MPVAFIDITAATYTITIVGFGKGNIMTRSVNEKSPFYITLAFTDEAGDPFTPTSVEWRLDNDDTGAEIVGWTALASPAASMSHIVPPENNVIINATSVREARKLGIRIDDGLATEAHEEYKYHVINLKGPSGS